MKKVFYSLTLLALIAISASCSNDDDHDTPNAQQNIEKRALELGFSGAEAYKISVAEEHAAGSHLNCDPQSDGTHKPCAYSDHSGEKHNGTHHNGTDHGTHDANGHSHKDGNHH